MANTCKAIKANGEPCESAAWEGSDFCLWHNDELKEQQHEARVKGGTNRRTTATSPWPGPIETASDLMTIINISLQDAFQMEAGERRQRSISSLLRIALDALPIVDVDARLRILENLIYANKDNIDKN
jgi:hypothetical protein